LILLGAVFYFGWPIIEAILIALPIPDPKDITEKFSGLFKRTNKSIKRGGDTKLQKP
jgi:hypothetical protein